jgi:hypothetical protein
MECTEFFGTGLDELGKELLDYLDRVGGTPLEAGTVDALPADRQPAKWQEFYNLELLLPEEKVDRFRQFGAKLLELGERAKGVAGDVQSADSFVREVAEVFGWAGEHLEGLGTDEAAAKLAEAGGILSRGIKDDKEADKVAQLAKRGLTSKSGGLAGDCSQLAAKLADAVPEDTKTKLEDVAGAYDDDATAARRAFRTFNTATLQPLATALRAIVTGA